MLEGKEGDLWRLFRAPDPRAELSYHLGFSFLSNLLSRLDGPERPACLSPWTLDDGDAILRTCPAVVDEPGHFLDHIDRTALIDHPHAIFSNLQVHMPATRPGLSTLLKLAEACAFLSRLERIVYCGIGGGLPVPKSSYILRVCASCVRGTKTWLSPSMA